MDKGYADTVRLLLTVAPEVFTNDIFAMKGGTAINLFVQDMPRLSVDIDVVFLPRQMPRDEAVAAIDAELAAIGQRVASLGLRARRLRSVAIGDTKPIVENDTTQVRSAWTCKQPVTDIQRQGHRTLLPLTHGAVIWRTRLPATVSRSLFDELHVAASLESPTGRERPFGQVEPRRTIRA
jgi:hypothetical protein